ncbi:MAG: aminomethyl transferase family protein [Thermoleophilia bacterium]|nr:aminomethyl transferase family protein [Thermoleophilia bacterium]
MSNDIVRTAFDRVQRELGGELVDWEGWYWPNQFGDPIAEHQAIRTGVAVWDASPLRKWELSGPDALRAADLAFTNDMKSLEIGQVRYAPFCDESGAMVGDGTVFRFAEDRCLAITALDSDLDHIRDVAAGLDVAVEPRTAELPQLGVNGPRAREVLAPLCDADLAGLRYFRFWPEPVALGGVPCFISRTGYSGELGYELFCEPRHAEDLWAVVTGAGARPYGLAAVETIRIESALVFIGYDYTPGETSPYDLGLDKLIRLDKEFRGREALAAQAPAPANRFVSLVVDGDVPEYGAAVSRGGEPVGTLTSPCESPTLGQVIGLAILRSDVARAGERVEVAVGAGTAPATIAPLPLYDTEKTRPRA